MTWGKLISNLLTALQPPFFIFMLCPGILQRVFHGF